MISARKGRCFMETIIPHFMCLSRNYSLSGVQFYNPNFTYSADLTDKSDAACFHP